MSTIQPVRMVQTINGHYPMASAFPENNDTLIGYLDGRHDRKAGLPPIKDGPRLYLLGYLSGYRLASEKA